MLLIVSVSHGILLTHDTGFCDTADEHSVCTQINIMFYLERHECIDIFVQKYQAVVCAVHFLACKFINTSAGLKAKLFKNRERSIHGQAVYIQDTRLLDHVMGIVCFIDVNCNAVRIVGKLCDCVDNQAIVFFAIV